MWATLHFRVSFPPDASTFAAALCTLVLLDALWFTASRSLYPPLEGVRLEYAPLAWAPLALAVACLQSPDAAAAWGVGVGFVCYAVFNGTELAIRPDWTAAAAAADMLWGTVACTVASVVAHSL